MQSLHLRWQGVNAEADALGKENKGGLSTSLRSAFGRGLYRHLMEHLLHDIARAMHRRVMDSKEWWLSRLARTEFTLFS